MNECDCLPVAVASAVNRIPDRSKQRQMGIPNLITISPGINDIPGTQHPTFIWPLQCPDDIGGMQAYPIKRRPAPSAAGFLNDGSMDSHNLPGWYGCFLPYPGDWKIFYNGGSAIRCCVLDASNPNILENLDTGCYAETIPAQSSVGVASGVVIAANPFIDYRLFQNDSVNTIYLALGRAAVLNQGIRLNANGGSYEMSRKAGNLWRGSVRGIATGAASNLLILDGGRANPT